MKSIIRPASVSLGVTTLCLLAVTGPLVSPSHLAIYHFQGHAGSLFLAVALDFLLVWIAMAGLLWLAVRSAGLFAALWFGLGVFLPAILLKNLAALTGSRVSRNQVLLSIGLPWIAVLAVALCPPARRVAIYTAARELLETVLSFASLVGVVGLVQLAWFGWAARDLNRPLRLHGVVARTASGARGRPPRIIWIVLDELSFQQVEEERFPGLRLPAFDALAAESTVFTQTVPAGNDTAKVLPALMTGAAVDDIRISPDGRLRELLAGSGWRAFDPHRTVFQDALDRGYGTAVAGWYNPYCRILPQVLDQCFWSYRIPHPGQMEVDSSVAENMIRPLPSLMYTVWHAAFSRSDWSRLDMDRSAMHLADYTDLVAAGDADLKDPALDFLLLHMPIPHPGGIFDRRHRRFTTGRSSYVDNLALADQYLGHVRQLLEQRGEWDSATVLVMGDHSWRTRGMWADSTEWTAEDQASSHGGDFDPRPFYLVKLPGQHEGRRIDEPFAAVRTRSLLDGLMDRRIATPDELVTWTQSTRP